jgi:hypothetical protein
MKINKLNFLSAIVLCLGIFTIACKKENVGPTNLLCEGNANGKLFPFKKGNTWDYIFQIDGVTQSGKNAVVVIGEDSTQNSKNYNVFFDTAFNMFGTSYLFRVDPASGNIINYQEGYNEVVEVVESPKRNQSWNYRFSSRTVVSLDTNLTTTVCSYKGLVMIEDDNGSTKQHIYYKRGLGMVAKVYKVFPEKAFYLNAVSLK